MKLKRDQIDRLLDLVKEEMGRIDDNEVQYDDNNDMYFQLADIEDVLNEMKERI